MELSGKEGLILAKDLDDTGKKGYYYLPACEDQQQQISAFILATPEKERNFYQVINKDSDNVYIHEYYDLDFDENGDIEQIK
jgi:hypothetical protein